MRSAIFLVALALALGAGGVASAAASHKRRTPAVKRKVPQGFMGVIADGPLDDPALDPNAEFRTMALNGVESVRFAMYWDLAQPYQTSADVPPLQGANFRDVAGVPTDFRFTDRLVGAAAFQGLSVLPVVVRAPIWARRHPDRPWSPPNPDEYAAFLRALVGRYGPSGSFWQENPGLPKVPIRDWQIWNEPVGPDFWDEERPFRPPPSPAYPGLYVKLLRAAHDAIKAADPGARVILAGIFGKGWSTLRSLYNYNHSVRRYFDAVALHPFTAKPENVILILTKARLVMNRHGDRRKPILVTELAWPSAAGRANQGLGFEVTEAQQATKLRRAYALLTAIRHGLKLERVYWDTWASDDLTAYTFHYAGLRRATASGFESKPSFFAFRRVALDLEGCARGKVSVTHCS
ncbi:MAG: polysaccharide biosynthesis protein PslG [Solirubrobacteraceae bacterium]|jgi:hypothetical protein|nr:polysaccharide biosynthesis protein PslG [Solirubrobacteraceae bacterium]